MAAFGVCMTSCSHDDSLSPAEIEQYISYFPETVDFEDPITVGLADNVCSFVDSTAKGRLMTFSPSVKGKTSINLDAQYIQFTPKAGALKQGRQYTASLDLAGLTGIKRLRPFRFNFYVQKREVELSDVIATPDPSDDTKAVIKGVIRFSCMPQDFVIENGIMSVEGDSCSVWIDATENIDGFYSGKRNQYDFEISGLKRSDGKGGSGRTVTLVCNPGAGFSKASTKVELPSMSGFKLISSTLHDGNEPYIELNFNKFLSKDQDLDGLVTIDRMSVARIVKSGYSARVYFLTNGNGSARLTASKFIKSADNEKLGNDVTKEITIEEPAPQVVIPLSGTILPDNDNLRLPFRAVNLAAVDVEVVKIYTGNVLRYLQGNELECRPYYYSSNLRQVGRLIYRRTVRLDTDKSLNLHNWQNFSIDLKGLFRQEKGAIYNIRFTFRKAYSLYNREKPDEFEIRKGITDADNAEWDSQYGYITRNAPDFDWAEYDWSETDDPGKPSYYMKNDRMPEYQVVASNLGLIVKAADEKRLSATVTDIMTAAPLNGVLVTAYNYQLQPVGSGYTDADGFAEINARNKPFIVTASNGKAQTYLKVNYGYELSTSNFDVSGTENADGIKGFIYGERGVWRPGDDIYLNIMVEDRNNRLPENHPVVMELYSPSGQIHDRQVSTKGQNGLYSFRTGTGEDAETGCWSAKFTVGGRTFYHDVPVETIKPNRLKVNIDLPDIIKSSGNRSISVESHWLAGGAASGLDANVNVEFLRKNDPFEACKAYTFNNPMQMFSMSEAEVLRGKLSQKGVLAGKYDLSSVRNAPGMLKANFVAHVQEAGGDESIGTKSVIYSPYKSYVGIDLSSRSFETDTEIKLNVVNLDEDGNPLQDRKLEYTIYKISWDWWWENDSDYLAGYVQSKSTRKVKNGVLTTKDGKAGIDFSVRYPDYGRYIVYVKDISSGHATGGQFVVDWPSWRDMSGRKDATAATVLSFSLDRSEYEVGETANVYLPKAKNGKVLISIENGSKILSRRWVSLDGEKETSYPIEVTADMAPNFYVNATLLQPHAQTVNNLPVRMYGVRGARVFNRQSILHPVISMPDVLKPLEKFSVKVSEQDGKPMSYTLAIVDEGLLDITAFRTPDPWTAMNAKEALGVRTWDMYKDMIGAYAGNFRNVLSIGGDGGFEIETKATERRFNPVVKFIGPFTLAPGSTDTHELTLPMYSGSVRVMAVAASSGGSYGNAEKTVPVKAPLMALSSMTRTLNCGDRVSLPVNLFVEDASMKNVSLSVKVTGPITVAGEASKTVEFTSPSSKMAYFQLACSDKRTGQARIIISASSKGTTISDTINVMVSNPQPKIYGTQTFTVNPGSSKTVSWEKFQNGTARIGVAAMPSVDFAGAFSNMSDYGHLCTEQLCSKALNILYTRRFLDDNDKSLAEKSLPEILARILNRQDGDGGFVYWPSGYSDEWVSSMAGEVMVEARRQGFDVRKEYLDKWKGYQSARAKYSDANSMTSAYRLYALALAGEKPKAEMNRLRESGNFSQEGWLRLAAAYAVIGQNDVAANMIKELPEKFTDGRKPAFDSELRNSAFNLDSWAVLGRTEEAVKEAGKVAEKFNSHSSTTQETAFVSTAMGHLADLLGESEVNVTVSGDGRKDRTIAGIKGAVNVPLTTESGKCVVTNNGVSTVHVLLSTVRQPVAGEKVSLPENRFGIEVRYYDGEDKEISSVSTLKQGTQFTAKIKVSGMLKSDNLALTFNAPSGWEIWNDRMYSFANWVSYRDIRDDKVIWYFSSGENDKSFTVKLRAAYKGTFILPSAVCEDMYNPEYRAVTEPVTVKVN